MRFTFFLIATLLSGLGVAKAAGPVETSPFAVQGVEVDVTDLSVKAAKDKALIDVQMKALALLGQNLGGSDVAAEFAKISSRPEAVGQCRTGPRIPETR